MSVTTYNIRHWRGWPTSPRMQSGKKPHPKALKWGDEWKVDLTPEEIVQLATDYDVMLRRTKQRTREGSVVWSDEIWLDERGGFFRRR